MWFRQNRETVDMIFIAKQTQQKCKEQNRDLYTLFVNLIKAFGTVSRPGLWNILPRIGVLPKMVKIIRCFHDGMNGRLANGSEGDEFPVTNGAKQGCILAPTLFGFLFSMMLCFFLHLRFRSGRPDLIQDRWRYLQHSTPDCKDDSHSLQKCDIDEKQWEIMATSSSGWRHAIRKGTEAYEN